jgi:CHRD domain
LGRRPRCTVSFAIGPLVAALMILAGCGDDETPTTPSNTGPIPFTAQLSAANEVPPVTNVDANARGVATITLTVPRNAAGTVTGGGTAAFSVPVTGFPPGTIVRGAHIHSAPAGQNPSPPGTVFLDTGLTAATAITLADGTGTLTFVNVNVTLDQATRIVANPAGFFFDLHTAANPDGAIRGQLAVQ